MSGAKKIVKKKDCPFCSMICYFLLLSCFVV